MLFLEVPEQGLVIGEMRSMAGMEEAEKRDLACRLLPARIRSSKADRFAWMMPAWKHDTDPPGECLCLVLAEPGLFRLLERPRVKSEQEPSLIVGPTGLKQLGRLQKSRAIVGFQQVALVTGVRLPGVGTASRDCLQRVRT